MLLQGRPLLVVSGVTVCNFYRWPKLNEFLGFFHFTYRGPIKPLISGDGAYLVGNGWLGKLRAYRQARRITRDDVLRMDVAGGYR